jgi:adenylate kinase family enzyme
MGASGSGTTTLARALANHWSVPHADADDYFWVPTNPPYVEKRPESHRLSLMLSVFVPREAWVLSASMVGWGEAVIDECDGIVFLTLDPEERLRRLEAREVHRRAGRGFDHGAWEAFLEWARGYDDPAFDGRSRAGHEKWLADRDRTVLRLDSAANPEDLVSAVLDWTPVG